jgi:predicted metal-binding membrane protein
MVWMRQPGQNWLNAAAAFVAMWMVMMVAMMLPSLVPMLLGYRRSLRGTGKTSLDGLTALVGAGYFSVWAVFGAITYPLGAILAAAGMRWMALERLAPLATGGAILLAGCFQLTVWKARQLRHCRDMPAWAESSTPDARSAWQYGLSLGVHCCLCCSGFMLILLVTGVMDLGIMAIVAVAITIERLAPRPERVTPAIGIVILIAGAFVIARTML